MFRILQNNDGCHVGSQVLYMTNASTSVINTQRAVDVSSQCEKVIDYFEGGSLGARKAAYVAIGGFDERFVGYGMEDCEFFNRLAAHGKFFNQRTIKMVHLWHDHANDWATAHKRNKEYMATIKDKPFIMRSHELNAAWNRKYLD
jgi:GT2 family glycosyltransferase